MTDTEIDKLIIEKVMKWTFNKSSFEQYEPSSWSYKGKKVWGAEFNPSTDISAAWEVVEKMNHSHIRGVINIVGPSDDSNKWFVHFTKKWYATESVFEFDGRAKTASKAICLAALKAVGVKVNDD